MRPLFLILLLVSINVEAVIIEYKIKKGDTITEICSTFNTTYEELIRLNSKEKLKRFWANDKIKIKLRSYKLQNYIIKKGDTLFSLVNKYHVNLNILYAINDSNILNRFWVGDKIILPIKVKIKASYKPQSRTETNSKISKKLIKKERIIKHHVKKGETIYSIAKKYNIDYKDLLRRYSEKIYEGQIIQIVKKETTLTPITPILKFKKQRLQFPYPIQTYISTSKQAVYSPIEGKIIGIRKLKGFGKAVFIKNRNFTTIITSKGLKTQKSIGEAIHKGEIIGSIDKNYALSLLFVNDSKIISLKDFIDGRS